MTARDLVFRLGLLPGATRRRQSVHLKLVHRPEAPFLLGRAWLRTCCVVLAPTAPARNLRKKVDVEPESASPSLAGKTSRRRKGETRRDGGALVHWSRTLSFPAPPRTHGRGSPLLLPFLEPTSQPMLLFVLSVPGQCSFRRSSKPTQLVTVPPFVLFHESGQPSTSHSIRRTPGEQA